VTLEVFEELNRLYNAPPDIYSFERALQAPALEMMLRGFRVDEYARQKGITLIRERIVHLTEVLNEFAFAVWGKPLNPRSHQQLKSFFYDAMRLPEQWTSQKGERKLSMNRETLEKLELYFHARPIISCILAIRELAKKLEVLETEISNGRMYTSYNIAGTESGRWSSSANAFGSGTNLQNIMPELRVIFVSDEGWVLVGIDLEQAESREVGFQCGLLFDDWSYLDACEGGDLHTTTARLIWPQAPWSNDPKADRAIADEPFYRHFSRRDMSKRGGHGSNYLGTPFTMSRHLKVPTKLMVDFQVSYFGAFPGIPRWHRWTAQALQTTQELTTPFGRRRHFFGRPTDDTTLREAIAYVPQSSTADRMNLGLWRVWREMGTRIQILAQVHDAIYFQVRESDDIAAVIRQALELINVPLKAPNGRVFSVPGEAKIGWNWGSYCCGDKSKPECAKCNLAPNPDGLRKWRGSDSRKRQTLMERPL
jgi:DNA polymerase-1